MEKQCSTCKLTKDVSEFYRRKSASSCQCKLCCRLAPSKICGTLDHFKSSRWDSIRQRTVNGGGAMNGGTGWCRYLERGIRLEMTRAEFRGWCDSQEGEVAALVARGEVPSVDRIRSDRHYSLDNIRVISRRKNTDLGREAGVLLVQRAIVGTNIKTGGQIFFKSLADAELRGFQRGNIAHCARGDYGFKTHKGYRWEYVDPPKCSLRGNPQK